MQIDLPDWSMPLFDRSLRYVAIHGGRASTKSHTVATSCLLHAAHEETRIVCGREVQKSMRDSVKRLLEDKIKEYNLGFYFNVLDSEIRGTQNDSLILFTGVHSNSVENVKSLEGADIFWGEEAQVFSQHSLNTITPTVRKKGSRLFFTWNPRHETDPTDVMFRKGEPPPRSCVLQVNYTDNPWFKDSPLYEEMLYDRRRDPDKYQHVWLGGYERFSDSRVFNNWRVEEFTAPDNVIFRFGADWGFAVDPTVLIRAYIVGRTIYVDYEAYSVKCSIPDTPALFLQVPGAEKWPIVADNARPEMIDYMYKNGFPKIMRAVKGPGSLEQGVEWLKAFDIVVHPRCQHTIDELSCYRYKIDKATQKPLPILNDADNNVIDALRYAVEGERRLEQAEAKQEPMPPPMPVKARWR